MAEHKTQATSASVEEFLTTVEHPTRRADGLRLHQIFSEETGFTAQMWGPTMVGYGRYNYVYDSGHSGSALATGFSPRKASLSIYVMPGYANFGHILDRLGKHKMGKACLYVNKLADIDETVLRELIRAGLEDLATRWEIHPN